MTIESPAILGHDTGNSSLVISQDPSLVHQLRSILERDHACRVETAASCREALALLKCQRADAIFLDFRDAAAEHDTSSVLGELGQYRADTVPIIAVSDQGYVCERAVMADLIVNGHVQLPLDRHRLASLLDSELAANLFNTVTGPVTPHVLRGKSVTYKTYTPMMFQLLDDLERMAVHDVTVLLSGETGTGKTTLARLIHELSPRRDSRLLTVACGALPPELIESELFGHTKGAFTSADQARLGKFDAAKDGSLLLDEIDVLSLAQQAKLLRVMETGEFEPVGSNETRCSQARLIVASNVDLKELMERDAFRADLYYRLNMMEYRIPPLRERCRDIVPLALDFIEDFCSSHAVSIQRVHPDFLTCLKSYAWPGNVRELKNHVRRAVLFCRSGILTPHDLALQIRQAPEAASQEPAPAPQPPTAGPETIFERVATSERHILEEALQKHDYNRTATARSLGLSRVGLYKKMKKYGMITPRRPSSTESN